MELLKKANGNDYSFASKELISGFVDLCKEAGTNNEQIVEMLQSLENSKIEEVNRSCSEA